MDGMKIRHPFSPGVRKENKTSHLVQEIRKALRIASCLHDTTDDLDKIDAYDERLRVAFKATMLETRENDGSDRSHSRVNHQQLRREKIWKSRAVKQNNSRNVKSFLIFMQ